MPSDPIVEETRQLRDAYAKRFNHDLTAICKDLRQQRSPHGNVTEHANDHKPMPAQDKPSHEGLIG